MNAPLHTSSTDSSSTVRVPVQHGALGAAPVDDASLLDDDLFASAPCGFLATTLDGVVVRANATFLALTGHTAEELEGRTTFSELLSPGGRIYHETHYEPMLHLHGRVREVAFDLVRADRSRLPVLVNATLARASSGEPVGVHLAVFDATHRREYERELLRAKERAERTERRAQELVQTLQSTLIPPEPPTIPGLAVSAAYRPAGNGEEVGGDFYDVFQIGEDDWVVTLGDVCGKGVAAAVVTALVRHTIRALAVQQPSPARVLELLNEVLLAHGTERYTTLVLLRLRRREGDWSVTLACGGHPLPITATGSGEVRQVGVAGSLIGILPEVDVTDDELTLAPGDLLVVHTDGVTEARRADGEFYGDGRLWRSMPAALAAREPAEQLMAEVLEFQGGRARDDIAVVTLGVPT